MISQPMFVTVVATAVVSASVGDFSFAAQASLHGRRIVFNEDSRSLYETNRQKPEDRERYFREFLRREVSYVPITTFCYLVATPDLEVYRAKVGKWDLLDLVIDELRPRGLEILGAVRMSDTHHTSFENAPKFAREHSHYVIKQPDGRTNETALDYSYPEVRAHRLGIMRDVVENYDLDGLELNFCRWAKHFPRDKGREKAPILTEYIGEIRRVLDKAAESRGRKRLTLGVRVPEGVRECWLAGIDIKSWIDSGNIDYVVVATWNEVDPQLPIGEFAELVRGKKCQLLAMMGNMMGGLWWGEPKVVGRGLAQFRNNYSGMLLTVEEARACAANYYAWGADGISFWNVGVNMGKTGKFANPQQWKRMWKWMNAVCDPKRVYDGPRRYHYLPLYKGIDSRKPPVRSYAFYTEPLSPLGRPKTQVLKFPDNEIGQRQAYRFLMADGRGGERLNGTLRFWWYHIGADDEVTVDVNGRKVDPGKIRRVPVGEMRKGLPGQRFEIALADCPPFKGNNELGLTLQTKSKRKKVPYVEELDVYVEGQVR